MVNSQWSTDIPFVSVSSLLLATSQSSESGDKLVYLCRALAMSRKKEYRMIFRVLSQRNHESFSTHFFRKVTMPLKAFVLHLIRYGRKNSKLYFSTLTITLTFNVNHTTHLISDAKIQHRESEVNNIISMCKRLQITLSFRNFAQTENIVRWASYSRSNVIIQLTDDHQSVERWPSYDKKIGKVKKIDGFKSPNGSIVNK